MVVAVVVGLGWLCASGYTKPEKIGYFSILFNFKQYKFSPIFVKVKFNRPRKKTVVLTTKSLCVPGFCLNSDPVRPCLN